MESMSDESRAIFIQTSGKIEADYQLIIDDVSLIHKLTQEITKNSYDLLEKIALINHSMDAIDSHVSKSLPLEINPDNLITHEIDIAALSQLKNTTVNNLEFVKSTVKRLTCMHTEQKYALSSLNELKRKTDYQMHQIGDYHQSLPRLRYSNKPNDIHKYDNFIDIMKQCSLNELLFLVMNKHNYLFCKIFYGEDEEKNTNLIRQYIDDLTAKAEAKLSNFDFEGFISYMQTLFGLYVYNGNMNCVVGKNKIDMTAVKTLTALDIAIQYNSLPVVKYIRDNHPNCSYNPTSLQLAELLGYTDVVDYINQ